MADILIPNMEMPKGCWWYDDDLRFHECWLTKVCHYHLTVGLYDNEYPDAEKSESCPLVKVPTHGDLKDTNKILQWLNRICDEGQSVSVGEIIDYIENAKTVIEAST